MYDSHFCPVLHANAILLENTHGSALEMLGLPRGTNVLATVFCTISVDGLVKGLQMKCLE